MEIVIKKTLYEAAQTWTPDEQGAKQDAIELHEALQGEVDSNTIITVLARSCDRRRSEISEKYSTLYGKDLRDRFRKKLPRGRFRQLVLIIMRPLAEFYARELRSALSGIIWNDKNTLIMLLCTVDENTLYNVNRCYWRLYKLSLEFDIKRNTSGYFQRLLVQLSLNRRSRDLRVNVELAKADAQDLLAAGVGRLGTDEATFNRILTTRSMPQLLKIFEEYEKLIGHPIEMDIYREFSGILQRGLISIVNVVRDRSSFVASQLYESMAGLGTKNRKLIRLIVTQSETDFTPVKKAFEEKYGITLSSYIADDTSGDFCKLLQALIGETESPYVLP